MNWFTWLYTHPTYGFSSKSKEEITDENNCFSNKFGLNVDEKDKSLPTMYCTPKMHEEPVGASFIAASKKCRTKLISQAVSKAFKLTFLSFYDKSYFYSYYSLFLYQFWIIENSKATLEKI